MGDSAISGLIEKKMFRNRKIKVRYFPRPKIEDTHHCATPLLENKTENIILYLGTNNALQSILIKKLEKKKKKMKFLQID